MTVAVGLDVLARDGFAPLKGRRVGAIVNPTSVDGRLIHLADLLAAADRVQLAALFGPEHGVRGVAQYMEAVAAEPRDRRTGVPVHSLYGHTYESLSPQPAALAGLDALVFDIQDVGARYYTYIYTMALAMKAASAAGLDFLVLDRPNPIGGVLLEGNLVAQGFRSFVGLYPIPNRHGMTVGELARLFNEREGIGCRLTVIPCEGWTRRQSYGQTGLTFVPPSPNMPTEATALVYPGMCLLEGTNVSEGRGTCRPFEQFGAPFLRGEEVVARLSVERLPGVRFRPVAFTPTFDKHRGELCEGAMIHVTDPESFRPLLTGLTIVACVRELAPDRFAWRTDAYEFVADVPAFDLLCGHGSVRAGLEGGRRPVDILASFEDELRAFEAQRAPFLMYG